MFTDEQQKFLKDLIADSQKALSEQVVNQVNTTVSGLAKRLIGEEIPKSIATQLNPITEKIQGVQGFDETKLGAVVKAQFDTLLEELAKQEEQQPPANTAPSQPDPAVVNQFQTQIDELKKQVEAARKIAETEKKTRVELSEAARLQSLDASLLDSLRGKVKAGTERELLSLIKGAGLLIEDKDSNQFMVEVPDEYGLKAQKPATEVIGDLISQRWSHYQDVRGGTGVGAAPTATQQATGGSNPNLNHFKVQEGKLTIDDNTLAQAASEGKLDDIIKELASATRA